MGKETLESMLDSFINEQLLQIILSNPADKDGILKVKIRPMVLKGELIYQAEEFTKKQAFHKNLSDAGIQEYIKAQLAGQFRQAEVLSELGNATVLVSKKGQATVKVKRTVSASLTKMVPAMSRLEHNRKKRYVLEEGRPVPFLEDLGVMTAEGKVVRSRYDKFRQINKYLELVAGCVDELPRDRRINIVDFGCGKSYLTFGLYYYLVRQLGLNVKIIGLDLKDDVIRFCEQVARDLGYNGLSFLTGDIQSYVSGEPIDMVVTLHACDVATDAAIVQAIGWDCRILLTVPCCQHELFPKIKNDRMKLMLKHGIIKERLSALLTDSIRGQLLEACGYDVNIMEFISLEHTPKNILIKAVRNGRPDRQKYQEYLDFARDWQIQPYLEEELVRIGRIPARTN